MKHVVITIEEISEITGLVLSGIYDKSRRQQWPFDEEASRGKPKKLFHVDALPEEIQAIWVKTLPLDELEPVLKWPIRMSYYQGGLKVWDAKSRGLCPQAREILLERFPEL